MKPCCNVCPMLWYNLWTLFREAIWVNLQHFFMHKPGLALGFNKTDYLHFVHIFGYRWTGRQSIAKPKYVSLVCRWTAGQNRELFGEKIAIKWLHVDIMIVDIHSGCMKKTFVLISNLLFSLLICLYFLVPKSSQKTISGPCLTKTQNLYFNICITYAIQWFVSRL